MDCSSHAPVGSSVHGVSQAIILEWVAISFSRGSSQPRDLAHISCIAGGLSTTAPPGKPHCRWFLYHRTSGETQGRLTDVQTQVSISEQQMVTFEAVMRLGFCCVLEIQNQILPSRDSLVSWKRGPQANEENGRVRPASGTCGHGGKVLWGEERSPFRWGWVRLLPGGQDQSRGWGSSSG